LLSELTARSTASNVDEILVDEQCCFTDIMLRKKAEITTLADLSVKVVAGKGTKLPLDSTVLFCRLLVVAHRHDDMTQYFAVPRPTSLWKSDKSSLSKELLKNADWTVRGTFSAAHTIVDSGRLLHMVKWQQGGLNSDVTGQYE